MNPHDEQQLRTLLDDAVSDVEPRHGLDAIRSRTGHPANRRPWLLGAGAAVVATAATIAAVTVLGNDSGPVSAPPVSSPSASVPKVTQESESTDASPKPDAEPPEQLSVPVYYVGSTPQGPRLYREFHPVDATQDPVAAGVEEAVNVQPLDPDYGSPWLGHGVTAADPVSRQGGVITVDLTSDQDLRPRSEGMSEAEATMAVQQVVYTAQAGMQTREPVQILVNGEHVDQIFGVPTAEPLAEGDETSTLAQVWIIDPPEGATLDSGFEVSGVGSFFEANVVWQLRRGGPEGEVVKEDYTTAEECCRMAPYSFTVEAPPGDYTLVVTDSDASGGEGFAPFSDTKSITIR